MTTSAILFDLDGTLIDTYRLYLESYRRALKPFLGYSPEDEEFIQRRPSSERRFLADWVGEENAAACHEAMCGHYEALHPALFEGMYEGTREMLSSLRSAGVPLGVVTGKGRRAWEITTAAIDIGEFPVVITDDDVEAPKPHPGGLLSAAEQLGMPPNSILYVGDSPGDLEAGRAAGMKVAAVMWPKTDAEDREWFEERIREHRPDWIFERPADVTQVFARWC